MIPTKRNAPWRALRFSPSPPEGSAAQGSPAVNALRVIGNFLADDPLDVEGVVRLSDAATAALQHDLAKETEKYELPPPTVDGMDCALAYLARTHANRVTGPINLTGLFVELLGSGRGQAAVNIYGGTSVVYGGGASVQMQSLDLGDDFAVPHLEWNRAGDKLWVGTVMRNAHNQYAGFNVTAKFRLPVVDLSRAR